MFSILEGVSYADMQDMLPPYISIGLVIFFKTSATSIPKLSKKHLHTPENKKKCQVHRYTQLVVVKKNQKVLIG
eukprot:SAG11_NODE_1029_length_6121_cov_24.347891_1_plen_74_part_00